MAQVAGAVRGEQGRRVIMPAERAVVLTAEGKDELEHELQTLRSVKLPDVTRRVQELTLDGDVSDNSEYEDTKEELMIVEARIREIEHLLRRAQVIDKTPNDGVVKLGSQVTLVDEDGHTERWTLVSPAEANTMNAKISTDSPVGAALLGKRAGEAVTVSAPGGDTTYRVQLVE